MKTRDKRWWMLALPFLAVSACGEEPTGPGDMALDLAPSFAKPPKPDGGGKPPKDKDIPLTVTFTDGSDGIRSDGDLIYEHGDRLVSAVIRTNGMFYFQAFGGRKNQEPERGVTVDWVVPEAVHHLGFLEEFAAEVGFTGNVELDDWPGFTSDVTLHTRNADGGMYTMEVGTSFVDGGKIGFNEYGDGGSWEWRLLFDTRSGDPEVADNVGLCVTHLNDNEWTLTADGVACGGAVDSVTELWRVQDGVFTHVADFNTPMHLTLEKYAG